MAEFLKKSWAWIAGCLGAVVLLASVYLSGRSLRKGDIELGVAKRELEKANTAYDDSVKKTAAIQERQKRLVSDILSEQLRRADELKRTKGLSDAEVVEALRRNGDITDEH